MDSAAFGTEAPSPAVVFGELFAAVAMSEIWPAKDWADASPKAAPEHILEAYRRESPGSAEALRAFVCNWFDPPGKVATIQGGADLVAHIDAIWPALIRPSMEAGGRDSALSLPHPYVAPGGRFRECYYWDAYFTLLGLRDRPDIIRAAADNFAWQIDTLGFIPTANRRYYLGRSQPPFLFKIVQLLAETEGPHVAGAYLPQLIKEHAFWMDGAARLAPGEAFRRVVALPDGAVLNRYWDDSAGPRDESFAIDVAAAASAPHRHAEHVFRDIRAAAESGWDFSSRWLAHPGDFGSIATTSILPIDLNSILFGLESFISESCAALARADDAEAFAVRAAERRQAMNAYLWDADFGCFDDYDWRSNQQRNLVTAAALSPLFFGVATEEQARATGNVVERLLLAPGGLLATAEKTNLQWDAPNGWAPLQWIAVQGLKRYGANQLADEIRRRWIKTVEHVFSKTGRLVEKYDVVRGGVGGGGEYPLQDGFGWTNGVTKAFIEIEEHG